MMMLLAITGILSGAAVAYFFHVLGRPLWGAVAVLVLVLAVIGLDVYLGGNMGLSSLGAIALVPMILSRWLTAILLRRREDERQHP
jgi:hypothetical protein